MATIAADGSVLDVWFPAPELSDEPEAGTVRLSVAEVPAELAELAVPDEDRGVDVVVVRTAIASLDDKAADAYDAYLRRAPSRDSRRCGPGCADADRSRSTASTSSRGWWTTCCRPGCASPTRTGSDSVRTWRPARPSCTRAS